MKKRHKSKAAQLAAERDVELYVRLEFEDQVIVEEYLLRNAIDRSITTLFGEIGSQSIHVEIVSFKYGTATIRTKMKMLNQVRCALALYGLHDKRECAFRIDTKSEEDKNDDDDDDDDEEEGETLIIVMWKHFQFDPESINFSYHTDVKLNEFDTLLHSQWDRALAEDLFTFQIDNQIKQRVLDGDLHYTIELNPSRYEKRRMPYSFDCVVTPFDQSKFNFNKIKEAEILFSLDADQRTDQHLVIINNSPIRSYHVLLVPDRQLEQSQILTADALLFGLRFVVSSAHPYVYVGFNSLCGYASINHLHLHGIYLPDRVFLQTVKCAPFHSKSNCYLQDLFDVQAFAFEIKHVDEFDRIARYIHSVTNYLTLSNIAHNVSIVKGDSFSVVSEAALRIFVWFRQLKIGVKSTDRCNLACLELSGYVFLRYEDVFNELTELELRQNINGIALPLEEQKKIKEDVKNLLDQ